LPEGDSLEKAIAEFDTTFQPTAKADDSANAAD